MQNVGKTKEIGAVKEKSRIITREKIAAIYNELSREEDSTQPSNLYTDSYTSEPLAIKDKNTSLIVTEGLKKREPELAVKEIPEVDTWNEQDSEIKLNDSFEEDLNKKTLVAALEVNKRKDPSDIFGSLSLAPITKSLEPISANLDLKKQEMILSWFKERAQCEKNLIELVNSLNKCNSSLEKQDVLMEFKKEKIRHYTLLIRERFAIKELLNRIHDVHTSMEMSSLDVTVEQFKLIREEQSLLLEELQQEKNLNEQKMQENANLIFSTLKLDEESQLLIELMLKKFPSDAKVTFLIEKITKQLSHYENSQNKLNKKASKGSQEQLEEDSQKQLEEEVNNLKKEIDNLQKEKERLELSDRISKLIFKSDYKNLQPLPVDKFKLPENPDLISIQTQVEELHSSLKKEMEKCEKRHKLIKRAIEDLPSDIVSDDDRAELAEYLKTRLINEKIHYMRLDKEEKAISLWILEYCDYFYSPGFKDNLKKFIEDGKFEEEYVVYCFHRRLEKGLELKQDIGVPLDLGYLQTLRLESLYIVQNLITKFPHLKNVDPRIERKKCISKMKEQIEEIDTKIALMIKENSAIDSNRDRKKEATPSLGKGAAPDKTSDIVQKQGPEKVATKNKVESKIAINKGPKTNPVIPERNRVEGNLPQQPRISRNPQAKSTKNQNISEVAFGQNTRRENLQRPLTSRDLKDKPSKSPINGKGILKQNAAGKNTLGALTSREFKPSKSPINEKGILSQKTVGRNMQVPLTSREAKPSKSPNIKQISNQKEKSPLLISKINLENKGQNARPIPLNKDLIKPQNNGEQDVFTDIISPGLKQDNLNKGPFHLNLNLPALAGLGGIPTNSDRETVIRKGMSFFPSNEKFSKALKEITSNRGRDKEAIKNDHAQTERAYTSAFTEYFAEKKAKQGAKKDKLKLNVEEGISTNKNLEQKGLNNQGNQKRKNEQVEQVCSSLKF